MVRVGANGTPSVTEQPHDLERVCRECGLLCAGRCTLQRCKAELVDGVHVRAGFEQHAHHLEVDEAVRRVVRGGDRDAQGRAVVLPARVRVGSLRKERSDPSAVRCCGQPDLLSNSAMSRFDALFIRSRTKGESRRSIARTPRVADAPGLNKTAFRTWRRGTRVCGGRSRGLNRERRGACRGSTVAGAPKSAETPRWTGGQALRASEETAAPYSHRLPSRECPTRAPAFRCRGLHAGRRLTSDCPAAELW